MAYKITMVNFSKSLVQEDSVTGKNRGLYFYSTQKGSLISYLASTFPDKHINLIGLNSIFRFKTVIYKHFTAIKFPAVNSVSVSTILFNIICIFYLFTNKAGYIYLYTDANLYPYIGALLYAKLTKVPLIIDFRNPPRSYFYKSNPDAPGPVYNNKLQQLVDTLWMNYLDSIFLKNSSAIIHISPKSKDLLKTASDIYQKSIVVQSCPQNIFLSHKHRNRNVFQCDVPKSNDPIFSYWGIIHKKRKLDAVIEGFTKAKELDRQFKGHLYFIGDGDDLERLKLIVNDCNMDDIIFKGYMAHEELLSVLESSSVAIIPIPQVESFQYSSPIKLAEAIIMELPVIASDIEPNQIVREHNLGILCDHNADSYAQAFLKFGSFSDSEMDQLRNNCKKIRHLYTPENIFNDLQKVITREK